MTAKRCPTCGHVRQPEPLTTRERSLLSIIVAKIDADGIAPNTKEMAFAMDIRGKSLITNLLGALHQKGWIAHRKGKHRGVKVLHRPKGKIYVPGRNITAAKSPGRPSSDESSEIMIEKPKRAPGRPRNGVRSKRRDCLQCGRPFISHGSGDRMCEVCKDSPAWSSGNDFAMGA